MVTPKYFKFYQVGTLKNDETDLLVEQFLDNFLRIEETNSTSPSKKITSKTNIQIGKEEMETFEDKISDEEEDQMSVSSGTSMIA